MEGCGSTCALAVLHRRQIVESELQVALRKDNLSLRTPKAHVSSHKIRKRRKGHTTPRSFCGSCACTLRLYRAPDHSKKIQIPRRCCDVRIIIILKVRARRWLRERQEPAFTLLRPTIGAGPVCTGKTLSGRNLGLRTRLPDPRHGSLNFEVLRSKPTDESIQFGVLEAVPPGYIDRT